MEKFMEMMMLPFMKMMMAKVHGWGSPPILPATRKGPTSWLVQESKTLSPAAAAPALLLQENKTLSPAAATPAHLQQTKTLSPAAAPAHLQESKTTSPAATPALLQET